MLKLEGYSVGEKLHEGNYTLVFRGVRKSDDKSVIIKLLKSEYPTAEMLARFKAEYELTKLMDGDGVPKIYDYVAHSNSYVIIMEDIAAIALNKLIPFRRENLDQFYTIAIQISSILSRIHEKNIIHKDINPANIIVNPTSLEVKIIDFGIATRLQREDPDICSPNTLDGTLAYISPEQTGRMNRAMDYRTDFYSLGITFYHMLIGCLPFDSVEPIELVHCHLAKVPPETNALNKNIPKSLSDIVRCLVMKVAEQRYQSCFGLKHDLIKSKGLYDENNLSASFKLGEKDVLDRFQIPEKLYGRENEVELLLDAFDRVGQGTIELMLITGRAGVGKSSLVNEIQKPVLEKKGYFISGKYEQLNRNIPYFGIIQALQGLIKQILSDSTYKIANWKDRITASLGDSGQIIATLVPEIELLIGKQEKTIKLDLAENKNRFNEVFRNFFYAIVSEEQPVALFLDDLQWADQSSLKLIQLLVADKNIKGLFVIGAYRANEVELSHPLMLMIDDLKQNNIAIRKIVLEPLAEKSIKNYLADAFNVKAENCTELAELCLKKTNGNPFFLGQFLRALYEDDAIEFNVKEGCWGWDVIKIQQRQITDNVIDLMVDKVHRLPNETQLLMKAASCVGARFSVTSLSFLSEKSASYNAKHLWPAINDGLIIPIDDKYKLVEEDESVDAEYKFLNDRVQQAAYAIASESQKRNMHFKLGMKMMEQTTDEELNQIIFDIVGHLNKSIELVSDIQDRDNLAKYNLMAGTKAKQSIAYQSAIGYFNMGIKLLRDNCWEEQYELTRGLNLGLAEANFLSADYDKVHQTVDLLLENSTTQLEKIDPSRILLSSLLAESRTQEALKLLIKLMSALGIKLPLNPVPPHIIMEIIKTKFCFAGKNIEKLEALPEMVDPMKIAALKMLIKGGPAAVPIRPILFPIILLNIARLSVKYGNCLYSPMSYIAYAVITCALFNNVEKGYRYGKFALKLIDKYNAKEVKSMAVAGFNTFIRHRIEHLKHALPAVRLGYQYGIESGDLMFASANIMALSSTGLHSGANLNELYDEISKYESTISHFGQTLIYPTIRVYQQTVANLIGLNKEPCELIGNHFNEKEMASDEAYKSNMLLQSIYNIHKVYLLFVLGKPEESFVYIEAAKKYTKFALRSATIWIQLNYYESLSCAAVYNTSSRKEKRRCIKQIKKNQSVLKKWAKDAPMNYLHHYYLVDAELARINNDYNKATEYYDKAILFARDNGFAQDEAIANELAANYYLSLKREKIAKSYLRDAHYSFTNWGAVEKVKQLEKKHPELTISDMLQAGSTIVTASTTTLGTTITGPLDFISVMKASQVISGEIILSKLIEKILYILIENTGADKGIFLLAKNQELFVEGVCDADGETSDILASIALDEYGEIPVSVIKYVRRTSDDVIVHEATIDKNFSQDSYIKSNKPKSILSTPITQHGELIGAIYLENNVTTNAFTNDRVKVVDVLSGQISVSIENARLYQSFERFVPKQFLELLHRRNVTEVQVGDNTQRELSVLFLDIRNFTQQAENSSPQEVFTFLNDYLGNLGPVIVKHNGFIDKYIGDAIMALFPGGSADAIDTAIDLHLALDAFNLQCKKSGGDVVKVGIGINTGSAMLGTVGNESRMDGTVVGDAVNIASRLEGLTKVYGVSPIISEQTLASLTDSSKYNLRIIDRVKVKGKTRAIKIWQVFDCLGDDEKTKIKNIATIYEQAWMYYQGKEFEKAKQLFSQCLSLMPEDKPSAIFVKRCEQLIEHGSADDWDGTYELLEK